GAGDDGEECGGNEYRCGDGSSGEIVVAGDADNVAEGDGTDPSAEIAGGVHHAGGCPSESATDAHAHGQGGRKHEVHDAEASCGEQHDDGVAARCRHGDQRARGEHKANGGDPAV